MTELKPCPFCGGSNLAEGFHSPFVICEDCGAFGPGSADITHEEAVNRWNTRAERTCHINELDALTQTLSMANGCEWGECSECGSLTPIDSKFCIECGAKVIEEEE